MVELEIFYAKRNRRGSIIVGECETFKSIKRRVIQKFSDHSDVEETTFSICIIELPQPFARQRNRNKFSPCETAKVSDLLASLSAINIVGSICLTIVDSRGAGVDTFTPIRAEELLHASLLATSDKLENYNYGEDNSCTSWATTGYNAMGTGSAAAVDAESSSPGNGNGSNDASVTFIPWLFQPVSVLDSLFDELSSTALIQGRLLKKIHSPRKQDNWREEYCILDGRTSRLWHFPIAADTSSAGSSHKELGVSGLGVPSFIPLLNGCRTKAHEAVTLSTHRSDPTSFTVTIADDWLLDPACATATATTSNAGRLYADQRSFTFRAPSADQAGKWVSRLSSLHGMLLQPLLPPGPENPRLFTPAMAQFIQTYGEGSTTYLAAAEKVFAAQTGSSMGSHFHHSVTTSLAACGGGGAAGEENPDQDAAPIPVTARCASHWAGNGMLESIEDCIAVSQQANTQRGLDALESLMSFEGMLKNKYLRGYFQKFLTNNCTEETLLFWEYAEDYWRAHPYAQQPFSPAMHSRGPWGASSGASARSDVANEVLAALKRQDAVMLASTATVKQWAESLFLTFLHCNAPYQIGCCSAADVARVSNALDALGPDEMPPFNLFRSIQLSTFAFMRKMFYPDFIAQANYHRLLVAAVHVSDRVAMNSTILASCVTADREAPTIDLSVGSEESTAPSSASSLGPAAASINSAGAPRGRGFLGMMRDMVIKRADSSGSGTVAEGGREVSSSRKVDNRNYAARWRVTKLVVFEMVRSGFALTTTSTTSATATAATTTTTTSAGSGGGNAMYRMTRRNGKKRSSIIGDKVKKLQGLQRGVVRKIGWLPEWWWDLLPAIDVSAELDAHDESRLSDLVDQSGAEEEGEWEGRGLERIGLASESTLLDEAEDPFQKDLLYKATRTGGADPWAWLAPWENCEWRMENMNAVAATMEKVRQSSALQQTPSRRTDLHMELLLQKLLSAEEQLEARPAGQAGRVASLFLPAGWKPDSSSKQGVEAIKKAVLAGTQPDTLPAQMKYSASLPRCVSQVNFSNGRTLLCEYAHLQPTAFHLHGALSGLGTMIACAVVRCRYMRPASKPAPSLLRGFSKRGSSLMDRGSEAAALGTSSTHSPSRPLRPGGLVVTQIESVIISDCPSQALPTGSTSISRSTQQQTRSQRWEEFHVPGGNASTCSDWPRQCAVLYVCLGVPRLYLVDPVSLTPSACIDLHGLSRLAPSERYLQSIDLQDRTDCTWQLSPEGLDAEDCREAPRRWLQIMSALCLPSTSVVHILKAGYLQKRGQVNRAFKLRWFVLTSDLKLRYYKDDQAGIWKGTIDLSTDGANEASNSSSSSSNGSNGTPSGVARFEKEIVVTMQSTQRMFKLMAEDVAAAEDWLAALQDLLQSPYAASGTALGARSSSLRRLSGASESLLGEDAEGDDDDDD